jgi:formate hydrogenlyase subunit 3/multisubunit Na+/H+ antiporter MnhD subunit
MRGKKRTTEYYAYLLLTMGASSGAALSNDMVGFLIFWGALAVLLYFFLSLGSEKVAFKGLLIIGVSDFALILGVFLLYKLTGTLRMDQMGAVPLEGLVPSVAFILLMIGALAKAGAMPLHSWIPDAAQPVPVSVMALLPASLDKLLGIYLLSRICFDFFKLIPNSSLSLALMLIGSVTVIGAVMMALVQHNLKKLLSYHAISQVGYMVLGVGTGIPVGMAGGIFHMVNHAIYKSCLFLGAGSVEHKVGTTELDRLGGLAKWMPITFVTFLITALSISGVPPLNGFFSKWMVYQGVVEGGKLGGGGNFWIIWLLAAMFGSALTLASFIKATHSTFLGIESGEQSSLKVSDPPFSMTVPMIVLSILCILFGVFAYSFPLKFFVLPSVPQIPVLSQWIGWWQPGISTLLIIAGIGVGAGIYLMSKVRVGRESASYIGGEELSGEMRISGVRFYDTIQEFPGFGPIYKVAERGWLDPYNWGRGFGRGIAHLFFALDRGINYIWRGLTYLVLLAGRGESLAHTGNLHTYTVWFLLGLVLLLLALILAPGLGMLR